MKSLFGICVLIFVGAVGWRIGGQLDAQALGMAVGMLFGVMAGIPTALLMLASQRRETDVRGHHSQRPRIEVQQQPPQKIENHYHKHLHIHGAERDRLAEIEERSR